MYVVCVSIWVEPGHEEEFEKATRDNHLGTRSEPGNVRFDVLRMRGEPGRYFLYEVYRTEEDFSAHQKTAHYLAWRETVAAWMAKKREGLRFDSLLPADGNW
jgi:autoinducer 2-degrading protein